VLGGFLVALLGQFAANLQGDALNLAGTDGDAGQVQGDGRLGGRPQPGRGLNDLLQQPGAEAVVVQAQGRPQGGKSPARSRDSGKPARAG